MSDGVEDALMRALLPSAICGTAARELTSMLIRIAGARRMKCLLGRRAGPRPTPLGTLENISFTYVGGKPVDPFRHLVSPTLDAARVGHRERVSALKEAIRRVDVEARHCGLREMWLVGMTDAQFDDLSLAVKDKRSRHQHELAAMILGCPNDSDQERSSASQRFRRTCVDAGTLPLNPIELFRDGKRWNIPVFYFLDRRPADLERCAKAKRILIGAGELWGEEDPAFIAR